jgi:hypothetical protein
LRLRRWLRRRVRRLRRRMRLRLLIPVTKQNNPGEVFFKKKAF